ncbi:MAG: ACT domain-containing protein [Chloroflexi bacterium]|nr:ACT domain-containing protein [Chloroflexota bacterium]
MTQTAEQVLGNTELLTDEQVYRMLSLPTNCIALAAAILAEADQAFCALVVDKDEVTLLLRQDVHQTYAARLHMAGISGESYRLITFAAILEPDLIGFMAHIAKALAEAGIPILAFAAYSRDHIFVPADEYTRALDTLRTMQDEIRQGS